MDTLTIIYSSKSLNNMQSLNNKKRPGKEKGAKKKELGPCTH